jgi:hypothetical protein
MRSRLARLLLSKLLDVERQSVLSPDEQLSVIASNLPVLNPPPDDILRLSRKHAIERVQKRHYALTR